MIYTEKTLARAAKRENNNKRKYLVVNPLQGKHVPVSGMKAFEMFDALARKVRAAYLDGESERLLLIGFAETATAIGARLAVTLESLYMQTTREVLKNADYLFFTESHSHATEQKLCRNDIDEVIGKIDRIVFVEDEVTTGNTIMKIIDIIERMYPCAVRFAVASLLNGMDEQSLERYKERNIDVHYLVKTHHEGYTAVAEGYSDNGEYISEIVAPVAVTVRDIRESYMNTRRLCCGSEYSEACHKLAYRILTMANIDTDVCRSIAVIGTEECMYPAIYTADLIEKIGKGLEVVTHSTTRSPIAVSKDEGYPLKKRFTLRSLYDSERVTYIYDLKKYDCVIVITDSPEIPSEGLSTLVNALLGAGNENIQIYRWCEDE